MSWTLAAATLEQNINEFEVAVQLHEKHGAVMPGDIKLAILVSGIADKEIQSWLMMNSDRVRSYEDRIRAVTPAMLRDAARRYLDPDAALRIRILHESLVPKP